MSLSTASNYFNPYTTSGSGAISNYYNLSNQYAQHPSDYYNQLMSGFSLSPGQQYQQHEGEQAIASNNATKGLLGSGQMAKDLSDYGQYSTDQYQQEYLKNILGINQMGYNGLGNVSQLGMQGATSQAQLQEAMNQINATQNNAYTSGIFGLLGSGLGVLGSWL
jgi:hypothetical protein